ncbi:polysaccharide biosynthesis/export family protein [Flavobacterium sp. NG2]|uniref:polysaccharide biosynthesis/export family protein n=1 Tax=Flavobacterium sp. NG2 TaxID=3097547 RepID=UPI002A82F2EE|nr:polysaccharide biosynthesis/export family protein [Flavobacterium sp. NG2]WPR71627.1 polysaccharide biosynthesis/export family protein [Flavobacterium sp. NG2]
MKYLYLIKNNLVLFFICLFFSCGSKQEVVYYQNSDNLGKVESVNSYEIKIQADDLLMIIVSAEDPEVAAPFNLKAINVVSPTAQDLIGQQSSQLYLVDSQGTIDFPVLGKQKVSGKTRTEVVSMLTKKIATYIKNPIVNLRIMNFKVSVQGEVVAPGTFTINSERLTLLEALSMAKDLTIYGKRDNILVIREVDGKKTFNRVDLTKADIVNSPFYYLAQNDVVYVEPNRSKINASKIGPDTGVIISATSILVSLITLIISITK